MIDNFSNFSEDGNGNNDDGVSVDSVGQYQT
jgi:hypothetical protein